MRTVFFALIVASVCWSASESLSIFHVGNSISDQLDGVVSIAESKGDVIELGRKSIPGAGIGFNYDNGGIPGELGGESWDAILTLAFCNGRELGLENDARFIGYYFDAALANNPSSKLVAFTQWPSVGDGDYATAWNRTVDINAKGYAQPYGSADYHETLTTMLRNAYPQKDVVLFPIGHVLYEFDKRARAGTLPGYSTAHDLYRDDIHLNSEGKYVQNLTAYALYFGKHPGNATLTYYQWSGDETVSLEFADMAVELVWEVVTDMSGWTGVQGLGGTGRIVAARAMSRPVGYTPTARFTLMGRQIVDTHGNGANPWGVSLNSSGTTYAVATLVGRDR